MALGHNEGISMKSSTGGWTARPVGRRREDRIVGASRATERVIEQISAAARSDLPVRIVGPSGTGKEFAARAVHAWGTHADGPFATLSCDAVPEAIQARELFGSAAGASQFLPDACDGALVRAAKGTLLVEQLDRLNADATQLLVRALTERRFSRIGETAQQALAARIIVTCDGQPQGTFLGGIPHHAIELVPLADRREDILPLAAHFLASSAEEIGVAPVGFTADARAFLLAEPWTGNVRELRQRIRQAVRLTSDGAVSAEALLLAGQGDEIPVVQGGQAGLRDAVRRQPAPALLGQHQPRSAAGQEGPQGLLRRDPPHGDRPDPVPLAARRRMRAAVVQMTSGDDLAANLASADDLVREAVERSAELVALPENFAYLRREGGPVSCAQALDGEIVSRLRSWASELQIWLVGGSFPEAIPGDARVYNTCVCCSPAGDIAAVYRKIHLFDVDLRESGGDAYAESAVVSPGDSLAVASTPFGEVGLSICYDLRFPELYRALAGRGARFLAVPSAFTPQTGKDHWEVLLRARAIENQAFVLAPAQCGRHSEVRSSHGRSMIVDPWGVVLAQAADEPGVAVAECSLEHQDRVRARLPVLRHRRL